MASVSPATKVGFLVITFDTAVSSGFRPSATTRVATSYATTTSSANEIRHLFFILKSHKTSLSLSLSDFPSPSLKIWTIAARL
jgi:hypothetical protein